MNYFVILLILIGFTTMIMPNVFASCSSYVPISSDVGNFVEARTIFVGTVLEISNRPTELDLVTRETITFDIHHFLKGYASDGKVTSSYSSVGYHDFEVGQSYLVYAFGPSLDVSICSSPIPLYLATPVLLLFGIIQYYFVIVPAIIGGGILGYLIIKRRRK